jgi:hypothetical protein
VFDLAIGFVLNLAVLAIVARLWFTFGFKRGREDRSLEDFNTQHDDYWREGWAAGWEAADSKADAEWPT